MPGQFAGLARRFDDLTARFNDFVSHTAQAFASVQARLDALEQGQAQIKEIALEALKMARQAAAAANEARDEAAEAKTIAIEARDMAKEARDVAVEARDIAIEALDSSRQASRDSRRALGPSYERRVKPKLPCRCRDAFGLPRPRVIMDALNEPTPEFHSLIQKALDADTLSEIYNEILQEADFVLASEDGHYAVVEVSLTLEDRAVRRAALRATILSRATGSIAFAAVVAEDTGREQTQLAADLGIAMFQVEM